MLAQVARNAEDAYSLWRRDLAGADTADTSRHPSVSVNRAISEPEGLITGTGLLLRLTRCRRCSITVASSGFDQKQLSLSAPSRGKLEPNVSASSDIFVSECLMNPDPQFPRGSFDQTGLITFSMLAQTTLRHCVALY